MKTPDATAADTTSLRARELFKKRHRALQSRTDANFAILMICQWIAALVFTLVYSPRTWTVDQSFVHPHVWLVVFLGGVVTSVSVLLARIRPGSTVTRHVIAASQAVMSAILIAITGGRIETHFHIFGSLAFLSFYRDWRVLVTASLIVAVDHLARGFFFPHSIFGIDALSSWRWLEHAGWVIFEDTFLIIAIRQGLAEMKAATRQEASLEIINSDIQRQVEERTAELQKTYRDLMDASRRAGMAEIASNVLHNVGNVLNSVNVGSQCAAGHLRKSKLQTLSRLAGLLRDNEHCLADFVSQDPRGVKLPDFMEELAQGLAVKQDAALSELETLQKHIEHINQIIAMQQNYATGGGLLETLSLSEVIEDAFRMNAAAFHSAATELVHQVDPGLPPVTADRNKLLLILVNLIRNARHACVDSNATDKCVTVQARVSDSGSTQISVSDNGIGIPPENLTLIFQHGFTTRKEGHGFGLHSSALAAGEMGGSLHAQSAGPGQGATFTLDIPLHSEN